MNGELEDLYQQVILDHGKNPRNFRVLPDANRQAEGLNPLCGDHFKMYVRVDGETIREVSFQGTGCAISRASASLMTQAVKGRSIPEARALFERFHQLVTSGPEGLDADALGKLAVMAGVSQFPTRVKCASLAWHTLKSALEAGETVSTE